MQLMLLLAPMSFCIGVFFTVLLCVSLGVTCWWVVRPPLWLPRRWSYWDDWPWRVLIVNLFLQPICLGFILLVLLTFPLPMDASLNILVLSLLSGYGVLAAILGVVVFLAGQCLSFSGWLEKVLSPSYKPRKRYWSIMFLLMLLVNTLVFVMLRLGYPLLVVVLGLIFAWMVGAAIVGVSPFYWLVRRWEQQHQQKLVLGPHRRLLAVDWDVEDE